MVLSSQNSTPVIIKLEKKKTLKMINFKCPKAVQLVQLVLVNWSIINKHAGMAHPESKKSWKKELISKPEIILFISIIFLNRNFLFLVNTIKLVL